MRAVLADKARIGHTDQIRELLRKYGADRLSAVDPKHYEALLRDVEGLGYTVTAVNRYRPECGFMLFYIGTTPDRVDKAREGFERIIRDVCDKPRFRRQPD